MAVTSLGYVIIEARDLSAWRDFACNIAGLMPAAADREDVALFRMDDRPFRLWVQKGDRDAFIAPGWEFSTQEDFEAALAKLDKSKPVNVLYRRGEWAQYALIRPSK